MRWPLAAVLVGVLVGCGGGKETAKKPPPAPKLAELPGGGRIVFADPKRRIVAFYGNPDDPALGTLGVGKAAAVAQRLKRVAAKYDRPDRPVLPAMELLADVAEAAPGDEGLYRRRASNATIRRYLKAARSVGAILLLDIQPGRSDFLSEAKVLERWLRFPDVSLALDPEWHMAADQIPGQVIGSVDSADVVATGNWLDDLTARDKLPQKVLLVHEFTEGMIKRRELLRPYAHVAVVFNVDGFGDEPNKVAKYKELAGSPAFVFNGFKLFYEEDTGLMTPREVLRLKPAPDVVVYE
ncbi:MAG: hypothetical protein QOF76_4488 [Solirubrobacteraceae bacterium]|jgi:hypothetical protein|nr:hypothetical protein [Solirubrobacteraceae bacterium]